MNVPTFNFGAFFHGIFQRVRRVGEVSVRAFNPPRHIRLNSFGDSLDECLRALEKSANLPKGDLYIKSEPREVATFPIVRRGLSYTIGSHTSDLWKRIPSKQGYICGSVFESRERARITMEQSRRMSPLVLLGLHEANSCNFFASLHISKNCPGVYKDGVCTTCGDSKE